MARRKYRFTVLDEFQNFQAIVMGIRNLRKENNISNKVFWN